MNMQNVAKLDISEGEVRTIHDKNGNLIWGKVSYGVKYKGDTTQNGTPTPSAPVTVQTVTGEQTVSINGAAYTVNLGSIELCKIGTYQDYIYKSGDKWYVRKEVGKIVEDGSQAWYRLSTAISGKYMLDTDIAGMLPAVSQAVAPPVFCSHFAPKAFNDLHDNGTIGISGRQTGRDGVYIFDNVHNTAAAFQTWLQTNPMTIYYVLATPTNTEITNESLVAQLGTVEQWLIRYGYNAIVSGNLPIIIDRTAL